MRSNANRQPGSVVIRQQFSAALKFYTEKLDFHVTWTCRAGVDPYCSIVRGNTGLHIMTCSCEDRVHACRLWVRIHILDVDRLHDELVDNGLSMIKQPTTEPWGLREFEFHDPDGNHFVFFNFVECVLTRLLAIFFVFGPRAGRITGLLSRQA